MRVEDRTGVMRDRDDKTPNIILICENRAESKIVDLLGKPGQTVTGELHLSDGYGEFYIRLEPQTLKQSNFTKEASDFIFSKYGDMSASDHPQVIDYLITAISKLIIADALNGKYVTAINDAIELMDEEPAKEILRKAVT